MQPAVKKHLDLRQTPEGHWTVLMQVQITGDTCQTNQFCQCKVVTGQNSRGAYAKALCVCRAEQHACKQSKAAAAHWQRPPSPAAPGTKAATSCPARRVPDSPCHTSSSGSASHRLTSCSKQCNFDSDASAWVQAGCTSSMGMGHLAYRCHTLRLESKPATANCTNHGSFECRTMKLRRAAEACACQARRRHRALLLAVQAQLPHAALGAAAFDA